YYDFEVLRAFGPEDLEAIESRMVEVVKADYPFVREEVDRAEAKRRFKDDPLKLERIEDLGPDEVISVYTDGPFVDLCRGPHVPSTGRIKHFKLLHAAGADWRGDERRQMLQRIYGTAWFTKDELDGYLRRLDEAKKRDHRVLGKQLDLFSIQEDVGPGLICWHPKGAMIEFQLRRFIEDTILERGYSLVYTPNITREELFLRSGHLPLYAANQFPPMAAGEGESESVRYRVKPMNCPMHILIYASQQRSYRDLPVRLAEIATVYRNERSAPRHGMLRVRGWQGATIQLDFEQPERFGLEYTGEDNRPHRPVMIHRAIFGTLERFVGFLIEHFAGAFPLWLAPEQVRVLPISDDQLPAAREVQSKLRAAGLRAHLDERNETLNYKIRDAETHKVPYMAVVGQREAEAGTVAVRVRGSGKKQEVVPLEEFVKRLQAENRTRALSPLT